MGRPKIRIVCSSVFKNSECTNIEKSFTKKWMEWTLQAEKKERQRESGE